MDNWQPLEAEERGSAIERGEYVPPGDPRPDAPRLEWIRGNDPDELTRLANLKRKSLAAHGRRIIADGSFIESGDLVLYFASPRVRPGDDNRPVD